MTVRIYKAWPVAALMMAAACSHGGEGAAPQPSANGTGADETAGREVAAPLVSSTLPNARVPGAVAGQSLDTAEDGAASADQADASGTTRVYFRARPGRRLKGTAEVKPTENGAVLRVAVENAPPDLDRVRFFRADNCAVFGVGPGTYRSGNLGEADELAEIGELRLEQGRGTTAYELAGPADDPASLSGRAVVVFGPIDAYGDRATEPIACADFPRS